MIGALAIKRRRKKAGYVEPLPPLPSRHCGFVYILGGVAIVIGIILLIPALIGSTATYFVASGGLMGGGLLILVVACCLSNANDAESDLKPELDLESGLANQEPGSGRLTSLHSLADQQLASQLAINDSNLGFASEVLDAISLGPQMNSASLNHNQLNSVDHRYERAYASTPLPLVST